MTDLLERLKQALADRYTIERELGRGGMAVVHLARDQKLRRPVALKVLRPELAASLGADRFLREIEIAAKLNHPSILALYDCGEADGQLYYTMPFVEGESLRDRLNREKQLPIEDALQITNEVADALGHAHSLGIVHRDIKPENILFTAGHAVVSDFGIARAVTEAGMATLTETGLAVGTPAYMSPEQATGTKEIDARTDIYSLGCVLYEMLSGETPFLGKTPQAIVAKKLSEPTPRISVVREMVPGPVEQALTKALARTPADRFATAEQFTSALTVDTASFERRQRVLKLARRAAIGVVGLLVVAVAAFGISKYWAATRWKRVDLDPNVIAVMPFAVRAADPALGYLDEAAVELFYNTVYSGELGIRAVNPAVLLPAWTERQGRGDALDQDAPLQLAARFRAGRILQGAVVQAGNEITIRGSLSEVPGGDLIAEDTVAGDPAYAHELVFRLTVKLLGAELGEDADRLDTFVHREPAAIHAYLAGARAYNRGKYREAVRHFDHAMELDATFALAALRQAMAALAWDDPETTRTRLEQARALRATLNRRDRAALTAHSGFWSEDALSAARAWTAAAPDDPHAWLRLAEVLRTRRWLPDDWQRLARQALDSAWALDSTTPGILEVHMWTAFATADAEWIRRIADQYLPLADSTADWSVAHRWGIAMVLGDSTSVQEFRSRVVEGDATLASARVGFAIGAFSILAGLPLDDAELVLDRAWRHPSTQMDSIQVAGARTAIAVARGRLWDAAVGDARWVPPLSPAEELIRVIELWLLYPGLDSAAKSAAATLTRALESGEIAAMSEGRRPDTTAALARCRVALHHAARGDTVGVRERARRLTIDFRELGLKLHCPTYLEAMLEAQGGAESRSAIDSLEAMALRAGGYSISDMMGRLLVRLRRRRGELDAAWRTQQAMRPSYMTVAAYAKDEGDLAMLMGDTATAIEAYDRYLSFRTDPDPGPVRAEVDSVQAALAELLRVRG